MLYTERSWKALIDIGYLLGAEGGLAAASLHCELQPAGCSKPSALNLLQPQDCVDPFGLHYILQRCVMPRCTQLGHTALHCSMQNCTALHYSAVLPSTVRCSVLRC